MCFITTGFQSKRILCKVPRPAASEHCRARSRIRGFATVSPNLGSCAVSHNSLKSLDGLAAVWHIRKPEPSLAVS